MSGPYLLVSDVIDLVVESNKIGVYILSKDGKTAHYVGRSDDIASRLKQHASEQNKYQYFWFEYATSPMKAYYLECELYHKYNPPKNTNHPAVPPGTFWRCPVPGCPWS